MLKQKLHLFNDVLKRIQQIKTVDQVSDLQQIKCPTEDNQSTADCPAISNYCNYHGNYLPTKRLSPNKEAVSYDTDSSMT